ncbi:hypothetical protein SAMN06265222_10452 [Neorhodopirellula lusitana]|uniref:Uncharacterized protein n=1 Tax=Neorhodopirellula lusitana TaxID=445327 RepID=A0ABY1PYP0_9BACT|nr:hypothetical protein [Neorhodopirellula lusitana]SMP53089.1 hypothetical protein SAMN06265222_10452 [Neorhodopirellula lusitana]
MDAAGPGLPELDYLSWASREGLSEDVCLGRVRVKDAFWPRLRWARIGWVGIDATRRGAVSV